MWSLIERAKKVIFALVLSIIPVVLLYVQGKDTEIRSVLAWPIIQVSGVLASTTSAVTGVVSDFVFRYVYLVGRTDELHYLRAKVGQTDALIAMVTNLTAEKEEVLDTYLKTKSRAESVSVYAAVIGTAGAPMTQLIRIDRGAKDGVEVGNPVIADEVGVGQVLSVSSDFSDILLITDASSAIDVRVVETNARGLLRGITSSNEYLLEIRNHEAGLRVREGDLVVTSGVNSQFPSGIPIGQVFRVETSRDGLNSTAKIKPFAKMDTLRRVAVLKESSEQKSMVQSIFAPWPMATK